VALIPPNLKPPKLPSFSAPRSPRTQPVVLTLLLLVVGGLFGWLKLTEAPEDATLPVDSDSTPIEAENAPPAAKVDAELLRGVRDSTDAERIVREPEPFLHVLFEAAKLVPGDFRRLSATLADDATYQQILEAPDAWRGRAIVAKARFNFATTESVPLGDRDSAGKEMEFRYWRGVATDELGRTWSFSLLEEPNGIEPGDVIRIEGFFFKKFALFDPEHPTELIDPTLHLVGKRVVKSFLRMPPVRQLSTALLSTVRDYTIEDRLTLPEEPLWHVMSFVQNIDADALAAAAEVESGLGEATYLTNQALSKSPDEYRGTPVRLLGSVSSQQRPWFRDDENPLDLPQVWHSLLVHNGPAFSYLISAERPPEWISGQATVLVEGVFLKLHTYQAVNRQTVTCPVIVVKRFVPFRIETEGLRSNISWVLIGVSAPIVLGVLLLAARDRKAAVVLQEKQLKRRQARREESHAGGRAPGGGGG
jgi:hypothetical protein